MSKSHGPSRPSPHCQYTRCPSRLSRRSRRMTSHPACIWGGTEFCPNRRRKCSGHRRTNRCRTRRPSCSTPCRPSCSCRSTQNRPRGNSAPLCTSRLPSSHCVGSSSRQSPRRVLRPRRSNPLGPRRSVVNRSLKCSSAGGMPLPPLHSAQPTSGLSNSCARENSRFRLTDRFLS